VIQQRAGVTEREDASEHHADRAAREVASPDGGTPG
jgi:hypothetical protein